MFEQGHCIFILYRVLQIIQLVLTGGAGFVWLRRKSSLENTEFEEPLGHPKGGCCLGLEL